MQEKAQRTRGKFVHEIAMLQARLRECSMDDLCKKDHSLESTEAFDMLSTFESRIGLLIGQVISCPASSFKMNRFSSIHYEVFFFGEIYLSYLVTSGVI